MTATTVSKPSTSIVKAAPFAAVGFALAIIVIVAGNVNVHKGENGGAQEALSTGVLCLVLAAVLFGAIVPRVKRVEATTLALGIVAVASLVAFWSGITPVLASAAFAVAARSDALGGKAQTGRWLGAGAAVLAVAWTLATSHLF